MHSRNDIGALLSEHGLAPRRDLGQNFVVDANIVRKIARLADVGPGDHVVEIGAGLGSLTMALAETGATITAIEVDHGVAACVARRSSPICRTSRSSRPTRLRLDWKAMLAAATAWVLVANLPYNVATPLVVRPARRRARSRADAGDGAARGGRAAVRRGAAPRRTARSA